jgi:hypothetical protein
MKKLIVFMVLAFLAATVNPGHAFLDYLFGGSHTRDAIDNSAVGDLRAWWTGNPVYQFNPYYSGNPNPGQQGGGNMPPGQTFDMQGSAPSYGAGQDPYQPQPQASVTYFPPQGQQYGYGSYGPPQQAYGAPGAAMQYQGVPQAYQQVPQQYQQVPQQYQQIPQQYQQVPQQYPYQQAMPQQPYQQAAPQYYQQPQYQAGPQPYSYQGTYEQ